MSVPSLKNLGEICVRQGLVWRYSSLKVTLTMTFNCYRRPLLHAWLLPDLITMPNSCIRENSYPDLNTMPNNCVGKNSL